MFKISKVGYGRASERPRSLLITEMLVNMSPLDWIAIGQEISETNTCFVGGLFVPWSQRLEDRVRVWGKEAKPSWVCAVLTRPLWETGVWFILEIFKQLVGPSHTSEGKERNDWLPISPTLKILHFKKHCMRRPLLSLGDFKEAKSGREGNK